jgi:hypothetical protein
MNSGDDVNSGDCDDDDDYHGFQDEYTPVHT